MTDTIHTPPRRSERDLLIDTLAQLEQQSHNQHQAIRDLGKHFGWKAGQLSTHYLTSAKPVEAIAEVTTLDAVKSIAVLNFSSITVQIGYGGNTASAGNGFQVAPLSFLVLPIEANILDIGAAASDLAGVAAPGAEVAVIRFKTPQQLAAGPLGGASVTLAPGQTVDVTDRAARLVGHVTVDAQPSTNAANAGAGTATVGVASAQVIGARARAGSTFVNTSANWIYLGLGTAAVVGAGIALAPNGGSWDGRLGPTVWQGAVNAIAAAASSNLAYVEL